MIFKYDVEKIREDFPVLSKSIIYFDSACMSLKPKQVISKINEYYNEYPGCAGRSSHKLASRVEEEVAKSRNEVKNFINAKYDSEIIFTRNTTEGLNLVANSFGLKQGDEVIISDKEHNSNLLPWLKLQEKGIKIVVVDSNEDNTFNLENFKNRFTSNTKLVSVVHVSNLDGVENPIKEIAQITHQNNALLLVDAAQSAPHKELDVRKLDVDFMAFSGHKMLGPTGTGVLYGKKELLEKLDQFIVGGETVTDSTYQDYKKEELPMRFEAGLQDYAGIIGLGEACRYLKKIGLKKIAEHETKLNKMITEELGDNEKIELIGPKEAEKRSGIFSFNIKGKDMHHISRMLDKSKNIMTRSGAHCVHSWFNKHNMKGSVRASLYLYNTEEEVRTFIDEVKKILNL
ncbi:selenocysteine lyase [Candidatus Woesearchaeota archaeon B3_Woes]|nr:MAG: selenocysteine lyase [Candidatus Woesearchaeota archaeon B3_Woes]